MDNNQKTALDKTYRLHTTLLIPSNSDTHNNQEDMKKLKEYYKTWKVKNN